jgi:chromosome partitioning protein
VLPSMVSQLRHIFSFTNTDRSITMNLSAVAQINNKRARVDSEPSDESGDDRTVDESVAAFEEDSELPPWHPDPNRKECVPRRAGKSVPPKHKNFAFKIISTWNFKGGVGKTTTCFSLGYALAKTGKRVLFVDADPQMNLTEAAMSFKIGNSEVPQQDENDIFTRLQNLGATDNLYDSLKVAVQGNAIMPATVLDLIMVDPGTREEQENSDIKSDVMNISERLFLLPGSMDIAEFDESISAGMNSKPDSPFASQMNFPGAFYDLISKTAKFHKIEYVVVDLSPAVGHLNRAILFSSNVFLMPCRGDAFSRQAVRVLTAKLPRWLKTYNDFRDVTKELDWLKCRLPDHDVKFAGSVVVGCDFGLDFKPTSAAVIAALRKLREAMARFIAELPPQMLFVPNEDRPMSHASALEIAIFPNTHQLGLIAQRASIPAPYLPNRYLQNYVPRRGRYVKLEKKIMGPTKANRARQREMIERVAAHLLAVLHA